MIGTRQWFIRLAAMWEDSKPYPEACPQQRGKSNFPDALVD